MVEQPAQNDLSSSIEEEQMIVD